MLFTVGVFALMPSLDPPHGPKPEFSGALRSLHAATILQSYGAFGLAAVAAAMFLMQQHDLKFHKLRALLSLLPSIQRLELITFRLVAGRLRAADHRPRRRLATAASRRQTRISPTPKSSGPRCSGWCIWRRSWRIKFLDGSSRRFAVGVIIAFVFLLLTFGITNQFSPLHQNSPPPPTNSVAIQRRLLHSSPSLVTRQ